MRLARRPLAAGASRPIAGLSTHSGVVFALSYGDIPNSGPLGPDHGLTGLNLSLYGARCLILSSLQRGLDAPNLANNTRFEAK